MKLWPWGSSRKHQYPARAVIVPAYTIVVGEDIIITTNSVTRAHELTDRVNNRLRGHEGAATVEELRAAALGHRPGEKS